MDSQRSITSSKVLVYCKDPADRRLIETYLKESSDGEVITREVDQISELKIAADRGEADLVIADHEMPGHSGYWLEKILKDQLVPVVILVGPDAEAETEDTLDRSPAVCLPRTILSREALSQAVDGAVRKWQVIRRGEAHKDELERLANYDCLTGLLNRRAVIRRLEECVARSRSYGEELSLIILDIDRFKWVNETVGRARADAALQRVAALLKSKMGDADFVGRYGTDEFLVALPYADRESARIAAERIRRMIEVLELHDGEEIVCSLTVSAGLAEYQPGDDAATLTYRAERCLCRAKDTGRNRVE